MWKEPLALLQVLVLVEHEQRVLSEHLFHEERVRLPGVKLVRGPREDALDLGRVGDIDHPAERRHVRGEAVAEAAAAPLEVGDRAIPDQRELDELRQAWLRRS